MEEVKVKIIADTGKAQKNIEGVNDSIEQTGKGAKSATADVSEMGNQLDQTTGGAITKFKGLTGTLKGAVKGFKTLRGAMIATGIGALIIGLTALTAAFNGSEEGENKLSKVLAVMGALTGNVADLFADLGEAIINVFENPKQAIKDFANLIKTNIINRIEGILELVPALGKAINLVFKGEFSEAGKVATNAVAKVSLGVSDLTGKVKAATEGVKDFVKEQITEGQAAAKVADMRAKADKIERNLIVQRSKLEIAQLRLKSRQEDQFGSEERKQALLDAQKLEDSLLDKETLYLELRRDAQIQENTFSRSNKENLTLEAEAIAAVNRQVAARANTARQVQREVNTISKQIEAENKAIASQEKARQDLKIAEEKLRTDAIEKIQDQFVQKQRDKDAETELAKIELEEERKLAELDRLDATEKQKLEVISFYAGQKADLLDKKAKEEEELDEKVKEAKINIAKQGLSLIQEVAGKGSSIGKAAAVAQATISGIEGTINAFKTANASPITTAFPAYPYIQAGLAAAFSANNIKAIVSTKVPGGGGGGGGGAVAPASAPPAFNVVGAAPENQLAETISGQDKKPVKAFVVSTEVSNEQALNRQIETEASIG